MRRLRPPPSRLVRPKDSPGSRPALRGHANLPGVGDPPRRLLALRHGEAGEVGLVGGQPVLHHARLILRGTSLPDHDGQGRGPGDAPSLVDHQGCGMEYMRAQLRRAGQPAPNVVGIDERSIRTGHTYRIVVSDLARRRPIWFGGNDRSEESMDECYQWLGSSKSKKIRRAVRDRWKAFRTATRKPEHAPQAAILFDKFHVIRHLGKALDTVRKTEYYRLTGKDRRFINGQKYTRLSHRENLKPDGRRSLRLRLKANTRLNTAYRLKEEFGQLWDDEREGWARRFFENGRASLKWQRLKPYETFAEMIDRHGDGIAAYCKPENTVALGFVEGLNNKIRVIQRRSDGLRNEEYLRL